MNRAIKGCTHGEIIEWLERKFSGEKIYRDLEESPEFQADVDKAKKVQEFFASPRLPIDLLLVTRKLETIEEKRGKKAKRKRKKPFNYYTIYFAISSKECFKEEKKWKYLKRRLLFYQFYLSRITKPKRVEIVVVIPYFDIPGNIRNFFQDNGFGLLKVDTRNDKAEEVTQPQSLRMRMIKEFKASTEDVNDLGETVQRIYQKEKIENIGAFKEAFKEEEVAEGFAIFFDQYILDASDALAGITPEEFGERYIDRRLLNLMFKLKKVSYREKLQELTNEQLDENDNDYVFVSEAFQQLWKENIGIPYSKFLETYEPASLHVFAEGEVKQERYYRDHSIHQFQVFLLGIYIIDMLYEDFEKFGCKKPEICWLIASSFHDMAYPVELYDAWCTKFFKEVFGVDVELANLELKTIFVDQSFLSCMGYLIYSLCCIHEKKPDDNWLIDKKELVQFFYDEITREKKHCILSSLSLLKIIQTSSSDEKNQIIKTMSDANDTFDNIVQKVFVPSALAIALHDEKIWQKLRKGNGKVNSLEIFNNMEFIKDPISFLLIFCDVIQEWGRPSILSKKKKEPKEKRFHLGAVEKEQKERKAKRFHLGAVEADPAKGIYIKICTPKYLKKGKFFKEKLNELNSMQLFLEQPPDKRFIVRLEDKNHKGKNFEMKGSPP